MTNSGNFTVIATKTGIQTRGLSLLKLPEMHLLRPRAEFEDAAKNLLEYLGRYVIRDKPFRDGEKIAYGYWILMIRARAEGDFELFESTEDGTDFIRGADLTLRYWTEQSELCRQTGANFDPPRPEQKAALSAGVLEGDLPVWGVRYRAPSHMSGWYLTTESFSGDVKDLQVDHLYHVTSRRPDLARFLALPAGFRFELTSNGHSAGFDEQVERSG